MMAIKRALIFLLGSCVFVLTTTASDAVAAASTSLPNEVFWDNKDWPSDLISIGEFNRKRPKRDVKKVLDFLPLENPYLIKGQSNLDSIVKNDKLRAIFYQETRDDGTRYDEVEVRTQNGAWIKEVYLPPAFQLPNLSEFQLSCDSTLDVTVFYNGDTSLSVSNGNYLILAVFEGAWITEDEYKARTPVLEGTVLFAQSQIFPSKHGIYGDSQPHLTALRKSLVMLRPHNTEKGEGEGASEIFLEMTVRDAAGSVVSSGPIKMKKPDDIPKQAGWVDLGDTDVDDITFPPFLFNPYVIKHQSNLNKIANDKNAVFLTDAMNNVNREVEIQTWDGSWVRDIYLPKGETIPADSKVQLTCGSGYNVYIHYPNTFTGGLRSKEVSNGQAIIFILVNNIWLAQGDLDHNKYIFGHGFFTATLDEEWVQQGMVLEFEATSNSYEKNKVGILHKIKIGGVTELVITAIDAGFLTPPRNEFKFRNDETAQREYFETSPVSRLVVVQYETMHLEEVMLPSGKLYTEVSDTEGGVHSGDMRGFTGKLLMSHGIDLANYGISSSKSTSESSHPFTCALLAAHNTVGMYQNGRVVHGLSGGNGMITLASSIGNEFSHEVGHNYGLGHYVGGFEGSVHRPSKEINSSWGWDSQNNLFLPNFHSSDSGSDTCLDDKCQSPYLGKYKFGTDSMAGGSPMWGSNRFTMYTPHVAKKIQSFLESKAVWDPSSSTGFRKFEQTSKKMKEFVNDSNGQKVPRLHRVPVTTIVGYYDSSPTRGLTDYVFPAMHGAYGFVYKDDSSSSTGISDGCELHVKTQNKSGSNGENTLVYTLTSEIYKAEYMNKFHVNVATEVKPYKASIYCFDELRASRELDGPNQDEPPLTFTVHGIAFDSVDPCSKHTKKSKCKKDRKNRCRFKKMKGVKSCVPQPCTALTTKQLCKKGGCKWNKKAKACLDL
mmetsp:Transcript_27155/g.54332  ORF Transcript_27155/g.54332 Transcript_27155/m.54332 type:complete len:941 (+) Transcript_27155:135-2957(+)|eukprot:CAMPEP_0194328796 /NCGR_PEP_ID=MMETSP0171-20130528/46035_1 /TAXON_ID=218684 /ORGANISM="Corethron pennatum, Strain L29A3" /LENGTH=940 /DNA_ID=CAMNT_0039089289 /DNA_START=67 /DNA_END=2889 /DNA_ORIENTATION=+